MAAIDPHHINNNKIKGNKTVSSNELKQLYSNFKSIVTNQTMPGSSKKIMLKPFKKDIISILLQLDYDNTIDNLQKIKYRKILKGMSIISIGGRRSRQTKRGKRAHRGKSRKMRR